MGKSDVVLTPWYKTFIKPVGDTALLGFVNNNLFKGDLYDLQIGNWEINSNWHLQKKYNTIVCLRCAYFAKDPKRFIYKCLENLHPGGSLYVDWGVGDHWRFENYKIGWLKDKEQEYAYDKENFLWSAVWDESFLDNNEFKQFSNRVKKLHYDDVKKAIFEEVPSVLELKDLRSVCKLSYEMKTLWLDRPQLYTLLTITKLK